MADQPVASRFEFDRLRMELSKNDEEKQKLTEESIKKKHAGADEKEISALIPKTWEEKVKAEAEALEKEIAEKCKTEEEKALALLVAPDMVEAVMAAEAGKAAKAEKEKKAAPSRGLLSRLMTKSPEERAKQRILDKEKEARDRGDREKADVLQKERVELETKEVDRLEREVKEEREREIKDRDVEKKSTEQRQQEDSSNRGSGTVSGTVWTPSQGNEPISGTVGVGKDEDYNSTKQMDKLKSDAERLDRESKELKEKDELQRAEENQKRDDRRDERQKKTLENDRRDEERKERDREEAEKARALDLEADIQDRLRQDADKRDHEWRGGGVGSGGGTGDYSGLFADPGAGNAGAHQEVHVSAGSQAYLAADPTQTDDPYIMNLQREQKEKEEEEEKQRSGMVLQSRGGLFGSFFGSMVDAQQAKDMELEDERRDFEHKREKENQLRVQEHDDFLALKAREDERREKEHRDFEEHQARSAEIHRGQDDFHRLEERRREEDRERDRDRDRERERREFNERREEAARPVRSSLFGELYQTTASASSAPDTGGYVPPDYGSGGGSGYDSGYDAGGSGGGMPNDFEHLNYQNRMAEHQQEQFRHHQEAEVARRDFERADHDFREQQKHQFEMQRREMDDFSRKRMEHYHSHNESNMQYQSQRDDTFQRYQSSMSADTYSPPPLPPEYCPPPPPTGY